MVYFLSKIRALSFSGQRSTSLIVVGVEEIVHIRNFVLVKTNLANQSIVAIFCSDMTCQRESAEQNRRERKALTLIYSLVSSRALATH